MKINIFSKNIILVAVMLLVSAEIITVSSPVTIPSKATFINRTNQRIKFSINATNNNNPDKNTNTTKVASGVYIAPNGSYTFNFGNIFANVCLDNPWISANNIKGRTVDLPVKTCSNKAPTSTFNIFQTMQNGYTIIQKTWNVTFTNTTNKAIRLSINATNNAAKETIKIALRAIIDINKSITFAVGDNFCLDNPWISSKGVKGKTFLLPTRGCQNIAYTISQNSSGDYVIVQS